MTYLLSRTILTTGVLYSALTPTFAVASPAPSDMETLTVTGSRLPFDLNQLPATSTVIGEQEIARSGALQITDLLRALPGITIAQAGSAGALTEIRMRGSETNHLLVLIDGVIANDIGQGSAIDLAHLTAASVSRIELLHGAQSAVWGSGAIAGVLSITTKAQSQGSYFQVQVGTGSDHTSQVALNASGSSGDMQFSSYAELLETDGDNIALKGTEKDGYRNITTGGALRWTASAAHRFSASARVVDYTTDYDAIDFVVTGLPTDAANVTDGKQLSGQLDWQFTPADTSYQSNLALHYREDKNNSTANGVFDGGTTGQRYQFRWTHRYQIADWQLAGGLEYQRRQFKQRGLRTFADPNQHQQSYTTSLFTEAGKALLDDVIATVSLRFDDNNEFDNAFSYRAGLTWQLSPRYQLFISNARAVKNPTFTERFGYFPDTFTGNPDLMPEKSQQWEVGARAKWSRQWSGKLSYYQTRLQDEINGFVYDPQTMLTTAANKPEDSERDGIEAQLQFHSDAVGVRATYSYVEAQEPGQAELRRARHQASLVVSGELPVPGLSAYTKLAYTGSRQDIFYPPFPDPAQRIELSAYTLLSVNLAYQLTPAWQLNLRIDNALDAHYQDIVGYSENERRWRLSAGYSF
ncbi:TonB-dependent receptor [Salinimonas marina]|uniref:TonB-dependent receptor n=1 Tax=Salinimonas marina TaxID=2785918 RepID=A0A7S9DWI2_9ALTE|nr:TonB-dependent receptor [Salinimonas marina]QPG05263.1 TonB-dependent receptor [Salinimonas marina]